MEFRTADPATADLIRFLAACLDARDPGAPGQTKFVYDETARTLSVYDSGGTETVVATGRG